MTAVTSEENLYQITEIYCDFKLLKGTWTWKEENMFIILQTK